MPVKRVNKKGRRKVTLRKFHTHRGVLRTPGEEIELREDQIERLKAKGVIQEGRIWVPGAGGGSGE